jgi:hypothetical protein
MGTHPDIQSKSSGFERLSLGKLCRRIRRKVYRPKCFVANELEARVGKGCTHLLRCRWIFFRIEDILVQK